MTLLAPRSDAFAWIARLIEPRGSVVGREARRRARYTALCFVLLVPLGVVAFSITLISPDPGSTLLEKGAMLGGLAILLALYPLSRGPRYTLASHVAIAIVSLGIWVPWLVSAQKDVEILYFACIPLIMGGLLVGPMSAAVFSLGNVAAAFSITPILVLDEGVASGPAFSIPFFLLFVGGFAVNAAHLRERDLREVEDLARELAASEKRRVAMLHNIAHDLGSPLTPLRLQVAMIPPGTLRDDRVDILRRNVGQLERLVGDLRDLARVEGDAFKLRLRPVDLADLARAAVDSFRDDATARGIALEVDVEGALVSQADPERVTQVLYNLLTNALKFTPAGGSVRVEARADGDDHLVRVADAGRGLDAGEIARLFQPFSQVHEPSEVKERGTGLGLYIARGIMRAHGGDLDVASGGHGLGSTFTLRLPAG